MSRIFANAYDMQMYHVCNLGKKSASVPEMSEGDIQNGDDIDHTGKRQFLFTEKSFRNLLEHVLSQIGVLKFIL